MRNLQNKHPKQKAKAKQDVLEIKKVDNVRFKGSSRVNTWGHAHREPSSRKY
jgi:hypothetical protein